VAPIAHRHLAPGPLAIGEGLLKAESHDHVLLEQGSFVYDALNAWCPTPPLGANAHAPRWIRPLWSLMSRSAAMNSSAIAAPVSAVTMDKMRLIVHSRRSLWLVSRASLCRDRDDRHHGWRDDIEQGLYESRTLVPAVEDGEPEDKQERGAMSATPAANAPSIRASKNPNHMTTYAASGPGIVCPNATPSTKSPRTQPATTLHQVALHIADRGDRPTEALGTQAQEARRR
jgi:hypothetical protein